MSRSLRFWKLFLIAALGASVLVVPASSSAQCTEVKASPGAGFPLVILFGCPPTTGSGEPAAVFLFPRDRETGRRTPCVIARGTNYSLVSLCVLNSPVLLPPYDIGFEEIPIPPTNWCAATTLAGTGSGQPYFYVSWCTGDTVPDPGGPRLYVMENIEGAPARCLGVRLDGYVFVCLQNSPVAAA